MTNKDEQVSLKDIIIKSREWIRYLLSKWILIGAIGLTGGIIGFLYGYFAKPTYTASLSFVLQSNNNTGYLTGLASQFGIDLGVSTNDVFSGENIITLMNSQSIIKRILFREVPDSKDVLANMIARDLEMDKGWASNERTKNAFPFPTDANKLTPIQDSLVREMYKTVTEGFIHVSRPDKNASFYVVDATSKKELIAFYLAKYVVDETTKFYIETKTSVSKKNLGMLQKEADSLRILLSGAISSTASSYDKTYNLNPALQVERSSAQEGQLRVTALGTAYAEVLKNLEIAKMTLEKETPLYQVIDLPQMPLQATKPSTLFAMIIGGFIGGFIICLFLLLKKLSKEIMA